MTRRRAWAAAAALAAALVGGPAAADPLPGARLSLDDYFARRMSDTTAAPLAYARESPRRRGHRRGRRERRGHVAAHASVQSVVSDRAVALAHRRYAWLTGQSSVAAAAPPDPLRSGAVTRVEFAPSPVMPESPPAAEVLDQADLNDLDAVAPYVEEPGALNGIDAEAPAAPPLHPAGNAALGPVAVVLVMAAVVGGAFWRNRGMIGRRT